MRARLVCRRTLLRGLSSAASLLPAAALADRGKDLFTTDGQILSGGDKFAETVVVPQFDENGALVDGNGYSEEIQYRAVSADGASVQVIKSWVGTEGGGLKDPVTGTTASQLVLKSLPTKLNSIADLGRPEQVPLIKAFELEADLEKADLVAAAKRTVDGILFYDFDLALPATKCDATMATACLPQLVVLLSAAVFGGKLHIVRLDANPEEWCVPLRWHCEMCSAIPSGALRLHFSNLNFLF